MKITIQRFLELRDGKALPGTEDEMLELACFHFRSEMGRIEQALAQRKRPSSEEIREMEITACRKIIEIYKLLDQK